MSITVEEKRDSRQTDAQSASITYLVTATGEDAGDLDDEGAFEAVAASAPPTMNGFVGSNIAVKKELVAGRIWEVDATWGGNETKDKQSTTVDYEFNFQAPSEKIYQSIYTRGVYDVDGLLDREAYPSLYFGALNVKNNNGELTVEGEDLKPGTPTNTWIYKPRYSDIDLQYQTAVEQVMGAVNLYAFKGRQPRTMRLVGVDGSSSFAFGINPKWHIKYAFQHAANRSNFFAGGMKIGFKAGHDLLWGYYEDSWIDGARFKGVLKLPKLLFVEQVYPEVNMSVLRI